MKLSIIIPSLRHDNIKRCLGYVRGSLQGFDDYEIIVISPFYVLCDQWLREDYPAGPIPAINWGFSMAKGEWVTVLCDEVILQRNCYQNMLTVMERTENRDNIGDFAVLPYYNFEYYGKKFSPFPFIRKERTHQLGGLFDRRYRGFYADPDLSLRCYEAGSQVVRVPSAVIEFTNTHDSNHVNNVSKYLENDRAEFRARWDHLGEFKDC